MSVKSEKIAANEYKLTITIPADEFNAALDKAIDLKINDHAEKGFRKGQMPRALFMKKYGEAIGYEDAINTVLQTNYPKAIDEAGINPVSQPSIDLNWETVGRNNDLVVTASVTVKPEPKLGQYKGIEVETLSAEVTDADVEAELTKLQAEKAELVIKESAVENGDTAIIDFEGFKDGVAFEGGKGENYPLEIGSNSFIPGFEEQVIGMNINDEKEVNVTFPEEYHAEDLKGAPVVFKVKVNEVKTRQLPELNDDFVKELDKEGIDTLEQLTADLKETLTKQKETAAKNHIIDTVVEASAKNAEFEVPQAMIDEEAERMFNETKQRLQAQQGLDIELYLKFTGSNMEDFRAKLAEDAEKSLRFRLTLEAIANAENLEVSEEDLNKEFEKMAEAYGMPADQIKMYVSPDMLKDDLKNQKAVDFLVESAVKK